VGKLEVAKKHSRLSAHLPCATACCKQFERLLVYKVRMRRSPGRLSFISNACGIIHTIYILRFEQAHEVVFTGESKLLLKILNGACEV